MLIADPLDAASNPRFFGINADGIVYENTFTYSGVMPETYPPAVGAPLDR